DRCQIGGRRPFQRTPCRGRLPVQRLRGMTDATAGGYAPRSGSIRWTSPVARSGPTPSMTFPDIEMRGQCSSVLTQDRQVGRLGGFQGLRRVGRQGDGYQKLIAVIVA